MTKNVYDKIILYIYIYILFIWQESLAASRF